MRTCLVFLFLLFASTVWAQSIFLTKDEILSLPTTGGGWTAVKTAADQAPSSPQLSNQDERENVRTLARALVYLRTGTTSYRDKVVATLKLVPGTESGGRVLALGRKLGAYICAADLVGYRDATWVQFVKDVRRKTLDSKTLIGISEGKVNNWGSSAIWSRTCAAAYLGETAELARCAQVFKFYLGDRTAGFIPANDAFGCMAWQPDASKPCVICGPAAILQGHLMSGALPEELRRYGGDCGAFTWPPPKENYEYSALEGLFATAWVLSQNGFPDVWDWSDKALLRVMTWLYVTSNFPAVGDDTHTPHLPNAIYGTNFAAASPSAHGKLWGFEDWFARVGQAELPPPPPPDIKLAFEWHFDTVTKLWNCQTANEDVVGAGATSEAALKDWIAKNPGAIK